MFVKRFFKIIPCGRVQTYDTCVVVYEFHGVFTLKHYWDSLLFVYLSEQKEDIKNTYR